MKLGGIGEVIAERKLRLAQRDGRVTTITVKLGKPLEFPDETGFYAPFQIIGVGSEKAKYAGGVDGIQALQLAMKMIGAYLNAIREEQAAELTWEGGDNGDVGFPD